MKSQLLFQSAFCRKILFALFALSFSCKRGDNVAKISSLSEKSDSIVGLNSDDSRLFQSSGAVPVDIQGQLKIQFFNALRFVNSELRQRTGLKDDVRLVEIIAHKVDRSSINVSVDVNAGISVRKIGDGVLESKGQSDTNSTTGIKAGTQYDFVSQGYKITYKFEDSVGREKTKSAEIASEVYQYDLKNILQVEELLRVKSSASLNFDAVSALPEGLKQIVAVFFDKINLSISGSTSYERNSNLATSMFYRGRDGQNLTALETQLLKDVVVPLCRDVLKTRGWDKSPEKQGACQVDYPTISNPLDDIKVTKNNQLPVFPLRNCIKDSDGGLFNVPLYLVYFSVFRNGQSLVENEKIDFWKKSDAAYKKTAEWATVLDVPADQSRCTFKNSDELCLVAKYGSWNFAEKCKAIGVTGGDSELSLATVKNKDIIPR